MTNVVGIRFKPVTKIYYFLPLPNVSLEINDPVIVQTSRGKELGWVAFQEKKISDDDVRNTLKPVIRRATPLDLMQLKAHQAKEENALQQCQEKVAELNLPMKTVSAEYAYDGSRITFSFFSEKRVDFRELVRELVKIFHTRVEMRQIGARDEAKIVDGYGRCGRQFCCSSWLTEFHPVSIKMAKNQQLPLTPTEISGACGRLLCCLAYEDEVYIEHRRDLPKIGAAVTTSDGAGRVRGVNILNQHVIVEFETGSRVEVPLNDIELVSQPQKKSQPRKRKRKR